MATKTKPKRLVDLEGEELKELLELVKGSDSVELKLTVPSSGSREAVAALGVDALDAQIRQVFFLDTPDLALNDAGVVVRARRVQGKSADTVVKLRPVVPDVLCSERRKLAGFNVELDAMPGGYVCSASLKAKADNAEVREAALGQRPLRKLFTKDQRSFLAENAPDGIELDSLSVLGPIFVLKAKFSPEGAPAPLVGEVWLYPDGSRITELSTKCAPADMFRVAIESRLFLAERGIDLSGEQQTKTRTALEFFSNELRS